MSRYLVLHGIGRHQAQCSSYGVRKRNSGLGHRAEQGAPVGRVVSTAKTRSCITASPAVGCRHSWKLPMVHRLPPAAAAARHRPLHPPAPRWNEFKQTLTSLNPCRSVSSGEWRGDGDGSKPGMKRHSRSPQCGPCRRIPALAALVTAQGLHLPVGSTPFNYPQISMSRPTACLRTHLPLLAPALPCAPPCWPSQPHTNPSLA